MLSTVAKCVIFGIDCWTTTFAPLLSNVWSGQSITAKCAVLGQSRNNEVLQPNGECRLRI